MEIVSRSMKLISVARKTSPIIHQRSPRTMAIYCGGIIARLVRRTGKSHNGASPAVGDISRRTKEDDDVGTNSRMGRILEPREGHAGTGAEGIPGQEMPE